MVWMSSIFSWWSPLTVSPPSNKIFLLKRQLLPITNMSESTNIQGLSISFDNSNYSYSSHTRCIAASLTIITLLSMVTVISSIQPHHCLSYNHLHRLYHHLQAICCSFILSSAQTITAHFDKLYSQTLFPFQLFFSPVHSSVNVD